MTARWDSKERVTLWEYKEKAYPWEYKEEPLKVKVKDRGRLREGGRIWEHWKAGLTSPSIYTEMMEGLLRSQDLG